MIDGIDTHTEKISHDLSISLVDVALLLYYQYSEGTPIHGGAGGSLFCFALLFRFWKD